MAVLIRYGAALILPALVVYLALRPTRRRDIRRLGWAALGFGVALLPQAAYLLTHAAGPGVAESLADWSPANLLRSTLSGADGTAQFAQSNLVFYLFSPLWDATAGFLSLYTLPATMLGLGVLIRERRWPLLGLLLTWWAVPALFFAGTPYQAHRFVLAYLPALTILVGIGGARAFDWGFGLLWTRRPSQYMAQMLLGHVLLLGLILGLVQEARAMDRWVATQAGIQADELAVVALARQAAGAVSPTPPHAVAFGITAALYHYTGWAIHDLSLGDEEELTVFLAAPDPRLVMVPEGSLATQWVGTPLAARWAWLQTHYALTRQGTSGQYTVYTLAARP